MDVPVDEVETREAETFFSKKGGPEALFDDSMPPGWTVWRAQALLESEELARFESLRLDLIQRTKDAFDSGVTNTDMAEAVKDLLATAADTTVVADTTVIDYWFPIWEESETYADDWWDAWHDLIEAFPELLANADVPEGDDLSGSGGACAIPDEQIDDFFVDNFDSYYEYYFDGDAEVQFDPCEEDTPEGHYNNEDCEEDPATYCGTWGDFARASGCSTVVISAGVATFFGGLARRAALTLIGRLAAKTKMFAGGSAAFFGPIGCQCKYCTEDLESLCGKGDCDPAAGDTCGPLESNDKLER